MDPEDLLLLAEGVPSILNPNPGKNLFGSGNPTFLTHLREEQESGALQLLQPLVSIPSLPNHYQDNQAALLQLQRDGVSYRYYRIILVFEMVIPINVCLSAQVQSLGH